MSRDVDTLRPVDLERPLVDVSRGQRRTFSVRSLGWTVVDPDLDDLCSTSQSYSSDDVSDDRGTTACVVVQSRVNKSINRLSLGRHDMTDAVGRWGDVRYVMLCDVTVKFHYK